ncbi:MAG: cell division protein ZapA [candidate division NC10 bacterium]|nr:cell division protein ZapA [candidate division NC10 bacterium]
MGASEHLIQVEIFGERYTVRAQEDPGHIHRVAQYVDAKFYEIAKRSPSLPSPKMAVLASLEIADELLKLEEERGKVEAEAVARIGELVRLLEAELQG